MTVVVGIFTYDLNLLKIGQRPSFELDSQPYVYCRDLTIK